MKTIETVSPTSTSAPRPNMGGRLAEAAVHVLVWALVFSSPLVFNHGHTPESLSDCLGALFMPAVWALIFYAEYFILAPHFFIRGKKGLFFAFSALLVVIACIAVQWFFSTRMHRPAAVGKVPPHWLFIARDCVTMSLVATLGLSLRLSRSWHKAENARREAELGRKNAELNNLRNQVNPHFLLNTLNSIYALTMLSPEKAQVATLELSRLLRHALYGGQKQYTTLSEEVGFLDSYIRLMRMRTASSVEISATFRYPHDKEIRIAPLLFISLVENAFKHGVAPAEHCFIRISLNATDDGTVDFFCENSNHPKEQNKLSPGGIGLQNLRSRLDAIYAGRYYWNTTISQDGKTYQSHLVLQADVIN